MAPRSMRVLVLNSGSSSLKSAVFEVEDPQLEHPGSALWEGKVEWSGDSGRLEARLGSGKAKVESVKSADRTGAIEQLLATLGDGKEKLDAIGHRVVHGGQKLFDPKVVDGRVIESIREASAFAPLHNQAELEGIKAMQSVMPEVPQVAVFDTAFHRTNPPEAAVYAGPYSWVERGIRKYGFHGINHQYCGHRAASMLGRDAARLKLVTCHLGSGCSLAAIRNGESIETTMGFTPVDGLVMGTRSGTVDPGVLTYLMREDKAGADAIDEILNKKSGLLGIAGKSDMREIVAARAKGDERAGLAFDIFIHRLRGCIAQMAAALDGMDALIFTAGVGENSAEVRAATCEGLGFLGIRLDTAKNAKPELDCDISAHDSETKVLVIQAQEDWAIACECFRLLNKN